jgi:hypothetical protein
MRTLRRLLACLASLACLGCGEETETLFLANFEGQPKGQPAAQVGTLRIGLFDRVRVVDSSALDFKDAGQWLELTGHTEPNTVGSYLHNVFVRRAGEGRYLVTAILFIPEWSVAELGLADRPRSNLFNNPFLWLKFPTDGAMRHPPVTGGVWGRFPHGKRFTVAVNLNLGATSGTAKITLLGAAQGSLDLVVDPQSAEVAKDFESIILETGQEIPERSFYVKSLTVTYRPNPPPP